MLSNKKYVRHDNNDAAPRLSRVPARESLRGCEAPQGREGA